VTRHQRGIYALISQASCGETSGGLALIFIPPFEGAVSFIYLFYLSLENGLFAFFLT